MGRRFATDVSMEELIRLARRFEKFHLPEWCAVEGCVRPHRTMNLCTAHYLRLWKYRQKNPIDFGGYPYADVDSAVQPVKGRGISMQEYRCHVEGCGRKHVGRGLCRKHYQIWWRKNRESVVEA
jgi:hypothetical protein